MKSTATNKGKGIIIVKSIEEIQKIADELRKNNKIIGFVPTMGYLHEGHLSLMKIAKKECDICVVSIYVNPTQFAPFEDFSKYPRDFDKDLKLCASVNVDYLFFPTDKEMYPNGYETYVEAEGITKKLCGLSRPTHFRGVTTIVAKLFNIVKPHKAYFGQKDYQQSLVIKKMVKNMNYDIEIVACPIVREKDGLAMSSRNAYLSSHERKDAIALYHSLQKAKEMIENGEKNTAIIKNKITAIISSKKTAKIDYVEILNAENLGDLNKIGGKIVIALAVFIGKTRLIDNMIIDVENG